MRRNALIAIALGSLIWGSAVAVAASPPAAGPVSRATSLLSGKRFTHFSDTGSIGVPSSYDERLHLCPGGRFVYDEVSNLPDVSTRGARTVGRWQVLWARFTPRGAVARVRGVAPNRALLVTIASNGRRTTVGGRAASVAPSDLC